MSCPGPENYVAVLMIYGSAAQICVEEATLFQAYLDVHSGSVLAFNALKLMPTIFVLQGPGFTREFKDKG